MKSSAIYEKYKSREMLTSFNRFGLCTSYKETKLHRKILQSLLFPEAMIQVYHYQPIFRKVSLP